MSRKGNLNKYHVRIYPEKPKKGEKTCYTWLITATTKSSAIKCAGHLAFKWGIEVRQVTVYGMILPKSRRRWQKFIGDYIRERKKMVKLKELDKQTKRKPYPVKISNLIFNTGQSH